MPHRSGCVRVASSSSDLSLTPLDPGLLVRARVRCSVDRTSFKALRHGLTPLGRACFSRFRSFCCPFVDRGIRSNAEARRTANAPALVDHATLYLPAA
jgi:hypothetical protein